MRISDWSSDVCSSDLQKSPAAALRVEALLLAAAHERDLTGWADVMAMGPRSPRRAGSAPVVGHRILGPWSRARLSAMPVDRTPGRPEDVLDRITDGADLIVPLANGEPVSVIDAIEANAQRWQGVRIHQMQVMHDRPYLHGSVRDHLLHVPSFLSTTGMASGRKRGVSYV